jgi:hypothetical protein
MQLLEKILPFRVASIKTGAILSGDGREKHWKSDVERNSCVGLANGGQ